MLLAFATTTALSYRFQKSGIDVDLSPQYLVSCLKKKCEGEYPINAEFFLVKNGTVTESCMPYSSNYGTVESCIQNVIIIMKLKILLFKKYLFIN